MLRNELNIFSSQLTSVVLYKSKTKISFDHLVRCHLGIKADTLGESTDVEQIADGSVD